MSGPLIQIVLATYNGGRFLREQLETLAAQSYQDIEVLVADDGSTDDTLRIVTKFQKLGTLRLRCVENPQRLWPKGNFANLLTMTTAPYVMCCDQDDRWDSNKVEITLKRMLQAEAAHDVNTPVLVFSDMRLIDAEGEPLGGSYWRMAEEEPVKTTLRTLLMQNVVSGCTTMVNRALLDRALPMPVEEIVMHDYWMALVAACFGVLCPMQEQTMSYRRHGANVTPTGTKLSLRMRLRRMFGDPLVQQEFLLARRQVSAFLLRFRDIGPEQQSVLRAFVAMVDVRGLRRRYFALRHRLFRTGAMNQLKFFLRM